MGKYETKSKCVLECKEIINKLGNTNKISLNWIPGHEGHMGNEVADRLAKRGVEMKTDGPEPFVPISNKTKKRYLKEWVDKQIEKEWENRNDCRQTKLWLSDTNKKWSKELMNLNKIDIRYITQMITGHANLKRHKYVMGVEEDPTCDKCGEAEETPEHLLT